VEILIPPMETQRLYGTSDHHRRGVLRVVEVNALREFVPVRKKLDHLRLDVRSRHPALVKHERHPVSVDRTRTVAACDDEEIEESLAQLHRHPARLQVALDVIDRVGADSVGNDVHEERVATEVGDLVIIAGRDHPLQDLVLLVGERVTQDRTDLAAPE
jgi:hypothetical protein